MKGELRSPIDRNQYDLGRNHPSVKAGVFFNPFKTKRPAPVSAVPIRYGVVTSTRRPRRSAPCKRMAGVEPGRGSADGDHVVVDGAVPQDASYLLSQNTPSSKEVANTLKALPTSPVTIISAYIAGVRNASCASTILFPRPN